jgi:chromosome segregation ATPase
MNPIDGLHGEEDQLTMVRQLRTELGAVRSQLKQREEALAQLNRRLLVLERTTGVAMDDRVAAQIAALERAAAQIAALERLQRDRDSELEILRRECHHLATEIERIYATRLLRYAAPARRIYGGLRRLR